MLSHYRCRAAVARRVLAQRNENYRHYGDPVLWRASRCGQIQGRRTPLELGSFVQSPWKLSSLSVILLFLSLAVGIARKAAANGWRRWSHYESQRATWQWRLLSCYYCWRSCCYSMFPSLAGVPPVCRQSPNLPTSFLFDCVPPCMASHCCYKLSLWLDSFLASHRRWDPTRTSTTTESDTGDYYHLTY